MLAAYLTPNVPVWRYVLRVGLLSLLPALLIGALVIVALGTLGVDATQYGPQLQQVGLSHADSRIAFFIGVLVVSPLVETLLMAPVLWGLSCVVPHTGWRAAGSAILWGLLHASRAPLWGVFVAWPFFVFSHAYLAWRPYGWWKAVGVTTCIHLVHNLVPAFVVLLAVLHGFPASPGLRAALLTILAQP